jgi:hypothetical protein
MREHLIKIPNYGSLQARRTAEPLVRRQIVKKNYPIVTLITRSHKTGISWFILSAFKASSSEEGTCTSKEYIWKITAT